MRRTEQQRDMTDKLLVRNPAKRPSDATLMLFDVVGASSAHHALSSPEHTAAWLHRLFDPRVALSA